MTQHILKLISQVNQLRLFPLVMSFSLLSISLELIKVDWAVVRDWCVHMGQGHLEVVISETWNFIAIVLSNKINWEVCFVWWWGYRWFFTAVIMLTKVLNELLLIWIYWFRVVWDFLIKLTDNFDQRMSLKIFISFLRLVWHSDSFFECIQINPGGVLSRIDLVRHWVFMKHI